MLSPLLVVVRMNDKIKIKKEAGSHWHCHHLPRHHPTCCRGHCCGSFGHHHCRVGGGGDATSPCCCCTAEVHKDKKRGGEGSLRTPLHTSSPYSSSLLCAWVWVRGCNFGVAVVVVVVVVVAGVMVVVVAISLLIGCGIVGHMIWPITNLGILFVRLITLNTFKDGWVLYTHLCIELGNPAASFLRGARMFSYILVIAY